VSVGPGAGDFVGCGDLRVVGAGATGLTGAGSVGTTGVAITGTGAGVAETRAGAGVVTITGAGVAGEHPQLNIVKKKLVVEKSELAKSNTFVAMTNLHSCFSNCCLQCQALICSDKKNCKEH